MRSSETLFVRDPHNPILTRDDWPYTVNAVMNAGATTFRHETALVCRVDNPSQSKSLFLLLTTQKQNLELR